MRALLQVFALACLLAACAQTAAFRPAEMTGTWSLVSDDSILVYRFSDDGKSIRVTLGRKGGPLAAPMWTWSINNERSLEISTGDRAPLVYRKVRSDKDRIIVTDGGGATLIFEKGTVP